MLFYVLCAMPATLTLASMPSCATLSDAFVSFAMLLYAVLRYAALDYITEINLSSNLLQLRMPCCAKLQMPMLKLSSLC